MFSTSRSSRGNSGDPSKHRSGKKRPKGKQKKGAHTRKRMMGRSWSFFLAWATSLYSISTKQTSIFFSRQHPFYGCTSKAFHDQHEEGIAQQTTDRSGELRAHHEEHLREPCGGPGMEPPRLVITVLGCADTMKIDFRATVINSVNRPSKQAHFRCRALGSG